MAGENVVEITVKAKDDVGPGYASAEAKTAAFGRVVQATLRAEIRANDEARRAEDAHTRATRLLADAEKALGDNADQASRKHERLGGILSGMGGMFSGMGSKIGGGDWSGKLTDMAKNLGSNGLQGGGIFGLGAGAVAMASPIGAAAVAMGAFGAVAIPVMSKVLAAHQALTAAQLQYNKATTDKQRQAALKNEELATAGLTAGQKGLLGQLTQVEGMWGRLENKMTPFITTVAGMALKLVTAFMPAMNQLVPAGAKVIQAFLGPLTKLVSSPFFAKFITEMSQMAVAAGGILGPQLVDLIKVLFQLFMSVMPPGVQILGVMLPLIVELANDLIPVITWFAKVTAVTLQWLQAHHLLLPVLALVAAAILAIDAPVTLTVAAIAILIAAGVEIYRNWGKIWSAIKNAAITALKVIVDAFLNFAGAIINGAAAAFGWVPGLGPKLKEAAKKFNQFATDVNNALDNLKDRTVNVSAKFTTNFVAQGAGSNVRPLWAAGFAHGGIIGAAATGGMRSGLVMVGEHGRELLDLPAGTRVHSNPDTEHRLSRGGGDGGRIVLEWATGMDSDPLLKWLRNAIRVRGGDVQTVLGWS